MSEILKLVHALKEELKTVFGINTSLVVSNQLTYLSMRCQLSSKILTLYPQRMEFKSPWEEL